MNCIRFFIIFTGCWSNFLAEKRPKTHWNWEFWAIHFFRQIQSSRAGLELGFQSFPLSFLPCRTQIPAWIRPLRMDRTGHAHPCLYPVSYLAFIKANVRTWTWRTEKSRARGRTREWCNGPVLTPTSKRQSVKQLHAPYLETRFMRKWLIWGASWCQPWHRRDRRAADRRDEMTFCSSFPPTAVAAPPPSGKDQKVVVVRWEVTHRERWSKGRTWNGEWAMNDGRPCPSTAAATFFLPC